MRKVYLNYSATTPVAKAVLDEMMPYFSEKFGNANSMHAFGQEGAYAVDEARRKIADLLKVKPTEIYFTSGGTEADNWALKGIAHAKKEQGKHIITSKIEHAAILSSCAQLEQDGFRVTYLPVDKNGIVNPEDLEAAIDEDTTLVSIMTANNEIGSIQPIKELCAIAHRHGVLFHTDAVQAMGSIPVDVHDLGVDMMSFSGHKFYGPKGIGVLYIKSGIKPDKLIAGGHQERTRRGGTTNVPAVVGIAKALEIAITDLDKNYKHVKEIRDYFVSEIEKRIPYVIYNGDRERRLPQNANFAFEFIEGESLLLTLDLHGITCSSGSACSSGSLEPSHVLLATGLPVERAHGSIRFSFGKDTSKEDVDYVIENVVSAVEKLRNMSPLYAEFMGGKK